MFAVAFAPTTRALLLRVNNATTSSSSSPSSLSSSSTWTTSSSSVSTSVSTVITELFNSSATWRASDKEDGSVSFFLWLPYIIFTIALLSLICCSFLRFHSERGVQYRRRQEELNDKIQPTVQDELRLLSAEVTGDTASGRESTSGSQQHHARDLPSSRSAAAAGNHQQYHPNGGAPITREVPEHITFAEYTQVRSDDWNPANDVRSSKQKLSGNNNKKNSSSKPQASGSGNIVAKKKPTTARRPLVFTFNVNGSMVDVRCGEEERTNTFRLMPYDDDSRGGGRHSGSNGEYDFGVHSSRTTLHDKHRREDVNAGNKRPSNYHGRSDNTSGSGVRSGDQGSGMQKHDEAEGGRSRNHRPCSVHYRVADVHRGAGEDSEPNKNSSEDEALLLWQKHL